MNMNLTAEDADGCQVSLWETPTWVTKMILSENKCGNPDGGNAGVLRRYRIWVESHSQGVWTDSEARENMIWKIQDHLRKLDERPRPFYFWAE